MGKKEYKISLTVKAPAEYKATPEQMMGTFLSSDFESYYMRPEVEGEKKSGKQKEIKRSVDNTTGRIERTVRVEYPVPKALSTIFIKGGNNFYTVTEECESTVCHCTIGKEVIRGIGEVSAKVLIKVQQSTKTNVLAFKIEICVEIADTGPLSSAVSAITGSLIGDDYLIKVATNQVKTSFVHILSQLGPYNQEFMSKHKLFNPIHATKGE